MAGGNTSQRRLDAVIWALIAAEGLVVLGAPLVSDFHVVARSFAAPGIAGALLLLGYGFYTAHRPDPHLASALGSTAQLVAFAAFGAPLSYLAASLALPLQDSVFDAVDRLLGFDWLALLVWMNAHPLMRTILTGIYLSLMPQMIVAVLALSFAGRLGQLRVFLLSFFLAALVTIAISAVLPAEGVWTHYGLTPADAAVLPASSTSWPAFFGLRDGTLRFLTALGSEGIITFPSLHAALAALLIAGLWPVRVLRWPTLAVNSAMLVATPVEGSHYLVDVLAGLAIAGLALLAARAVAELARGSFAPSARPLPGAALHPENQAADV